MLFFCFVYLCKRGESTYVIPQGVVYVRIVLYCFKLMHDRILYATLKSTQLSGLTGVRLQLWWLHCSVVMVGTGRHPGFVSHSCGLISFFFFPRQVVFQQNFRKIG